MKDTCKGICTGVCTTVLGGLLITLFFFIWNDFFFQPKNLTGIWQFTYTVNETSYSAYKDMKLIYHVHLMQTGSMIFGTGEKIKEISEKNGEYYFEPDKRVHIELTGEVDYRFLGKDYVNLYYKEKGRKRYSSTLQQLKQVDKKTLSGVFFSTAANCSGSVVWKKLNKIKFPVSP